MAARHTLEWGIRVTAPAPDGFQNWPDTARHACIEAMARGLVAAQHKWPGCRIVADVSRCSQQWVNAWRLYRCITVEEQT